MCKYTAKVISLWYDNFGENHTALHRNGMTAIAKSEKMKEMSIPRLGTWASPSARSYFTQIAKTVGI